MDPVTVFTIISGVMDIVRRHGAQAHVLTDEEVQKEFFDEIREGKSIIAQWYISKGLPIPE